MKTKTFLFSLLFGYALIAQEYTLHKTIYTASNGEKVDIPLGKVSFADEVIRYEMGNPAPITQFQNSSQALYEPNYTSIKKPDFVSLGCGGQLTLKFSDNGFMNLKGDDLYVFEVGPAKEPADIEISIDGVTWIYAGRIEGGKSSIDLSDQDIDSSKVFYYLRITDLKGVCRSLTAGADIDAVAAINSVIELNINADVLFDVASYQLREAAIEVLDSISKSIKKTPKASILIQGHTDSDGSDIYNMNLSKNRSFAVKNLLRDFLVEKGIYDYEIEYFGKKIPKAPNDSEEKNS